MAYDDATGAGRPAATPGPFDDARGSRSARRHRCGLPLATYVLSCVGLLLMPAAAYVPGHRGETDHCLPSWLTGAEARASNPCSWVQESGPLVATVMAATAAPVATAIVLQIRAWRRMRAPGGLRSSTAHTLVAAGCLIAALCLLVFGYSARPR